MKKLVALLLACLMLACALPALAEDAPLHTFAGIPWDTAISACVAILEEKTGVGFEWTSATQPRILDIEPGYYNVLGIRVEASFEDFTVSYDPTEAYENGEAEWDDDAAWALSEIRIEGMDMPWDGGQDAREVWEKLQAHCGEPSRVYYLFSEYHWDGTTYEPYSVPQEEWPCILDDGLPFAQAQKETGFIVAVHFGNVELWVEVNENDDHALCYCMNLNYYAAPVTTYEEDGYEVKEFPWVNGDYVFTVIEPW